MCISYWAISLIYNLKKYTVLGVIHILRLFFLKGATPHARHTLLKTVQLFKKLRAHRRSSDSRNGAACGFRHKMCPSQSFVFI